MVVVVGLGVLVVVGVGVVVVVVRVGVVVVVVVGVGVVVLVVVGTGVVVVVVVGVGVVVVGTKTHVVAPTTGVYFPASQFMQEKFPDVGLYCPSRHDMHDFSHIVLTMSNPSKI